MSTQVDNDLTLAAADLAVQAPQEWDRFGMALANYFQKSLLELKNASNDQLYRAQGRSQALDGLLTHLASAKANAEKIRAPKG